MMTLEEIAAAEARAEATTQGPYGIEETHHTLYVGPLRKSGDGKVAEIIAAYNIEECTDSYIQRQTANAHFHAHARTDVPALADEVERRDTYWNREKHQYEDPMLTCPARVRELIAERRKEGK